MPRRIEPDETLPDAFALGVWNSAAIIGDRDDDFSITAGGRRSLQLILQPLSPGHSLLQFPVVFLALPVLLSFLIDPTTSPQPIKP